MYFKKILTKTYLIMLFAAGLAPFVCGASNMDSPNASAEQQDETQSEENFVAQSAILKYMVHPDTVAEKGGIDRVPLFKAYNKLKKIQQNIYYSQPEAHSLLMQLRDDRSKGKLSDNKIYTNPVLKYAQIKKITDASYEQAYTMAHLAAVEDFELLEFIIDLGTRTDAVDDYGHQPFGKAIQIFDSETTERLASYGRKDIDKAKSTEILNTQTEGLKAALTALQNFTAQPKTESSAQLPQSDQMQYMRDLVFYHITNQTLRHVPSNYLIDVGDEHGNTALLFALIMGDFRAFEKLLTLKPNISIRNEDFMNVAVMLEEYVEAFENFISDDDLIDSFVDNAQTKDNLEAQLDGFYQILNSPQMAQVIDCHQLLGEM